MELNGTTYNEETTLEMMGLLERLRLNKARVRFHWGDTMTGLDWGDDYHIMGTIGRSTGTKKIPLLIYNARSHGGPAILDSSIVKITTTQGKQVIYQHPKYHKETE